MGLVLIVISLEFVFVMFWLIKKWILCLNLIWFVWIFWFFKIVIICVNGFLCFCYMCMFFLICKDFWILGFLKNGYIMVMLLCLGIMMVVSCLLCYYWMFEKYIMVVLGFSIIVLIFCFVMIVCVLVIFVSCFLWFMGVILFIMDVRFFKFDLVGVGEFVDIVVVNNLVVVRLLNFIKFFLFMLKLMWKCRLWWDYV